MAKGVFVGDAMRFSVKLLRELLAQEDGGASVVVEVKDVRMEMDGTKTLTVERKEPARGHR